jgi:hypothetical protein
VAEGWTPAEEELRDELLDEIGFILPGDHRHAAEITLKVLGVLERLAWGKKAERIAIRDSRIETEADRG